MATRSVRRRVVLLLATAIVSPLAGLAPLGWMHLVTRGARAPEPAPVALVLGAGLTPSGHPTPLLGDRIERAAQLWHAGTVQVLLMSGDHGRAHHDEVAAMAAYAERLGVPRERIALDHAGFDTYDSCYRAREIFGVRRAVVVTTKFHLARAVYTCRRLGIDATGSGTPDWTRYRDDAPGWQAREVVAAVKALVELHVTRPGPRFLGPPERLPDAAWENPQP